MPTAAIATPATALGDFDLAAHERPRILRLANAARAAPPRSITSIVNPRSAGGPHDFSSEGDYWWPDPDRPNGPYLCRDGQINPDNFVGHRELLIDMASDVAALTAAFTITGDRAYAEAAEHQLVTWFIDARTRMHPDLQFAQAIRGVTPGRAIGIIDTVHLCDVALAIAALRRARAIDAATIARLTAWFAEYLRWLCASPNGREERDMPNNHATTWALQVAAFACLTGDAWRLASVRRRFRWILVRRQMDRSGAFPLELSRTRPYCYSAFQLSALTALAWLASTPRRDLMALRLRDGRGVTRAIEFLAPYLADKGRWPYARDVTHWDDFPVREPALLFGAMSTGRRDWLALWQQLEPDPPNAEVRRVFPIRQPVLWMPGVA
ncbi:MAG TPA: alginate lyase family protein [Gemmatimonadaceae bacterium]|nr:alginate lyase family protein [Gemmatimonadaceae bacterium]